MVKTLFLEAPYVGTVALCQDTLNYIKKNNYKKIGLYAAIQFCHNLETVKKQLQEMKVQVFSSQPKRTGCEAQVLGCDNASDSLNLHEEVDAFLYIGDGKFHPLALAYGQQKEILCNDPIGNAFSLITPEDVAKNMQKQKASLVKFLTKRNIGVIISLKPGQEFYKASLPLEQKYPNKKFYYFIDNTISYNQLENFPFIDVWVNTACPRIGTDDQEMFRKGVVNLKDVLSTSLT